MDLIKRYGRRGSFGPHILFFSLQLSNELLIRLRSLYNKEIVKLWGFLFVLGPVKKKKTTQGKGW